MIDLLPDAEFLKDGREYAFRRDGVVYLVRCFKCDQENYLPAVASGQCAWCLWIFNEGELESGN